LRFGLGRFTTAEQIDFALKEVSIVVKNLREENKSFNPL